MKSFGYGFGGMAKKLGSVGQGLISIKQGTGQMSWTLRKGTGQGPVITMFMKEEYQTLSCNKKTVLDIL